MFSCLFFARSPIKKKIDRNDGIDLFKKQKKTATTQQQ